MQQLHLQSRLAHSRGCPVGEPAPASFTLQQQFNHSRGSLRQTCLPQSLRHSHRQQRRATTTGQRRVVVAAAAISPDTSVAIAGATGLVGTRLVEKLVQQGAKVVILSRNPDQSRSKLKQNGVQFYDPSQWQEAMRGVTGVINLAGEPIATRWNERLKQEIKNSRVTMTNKLVAAINGLPKDQRPKALVNASAVGFYGSNDTASLNETSPIGRDYLAQTCKEWEQAAQKAETRVVVIRTGIVLAKEGGALGKMMPVFSIFAGGPLGTGQQWCSWIHRDDLVDLYLEAVTNSSYSGIYNGTAPNPVRMSELCASLGSAMGRPSWLPVPNFALQAVLGEGAQIVLEGQRVLPARAQEEGFQFQYSNVDAALKNIYRGA